MVPVMENALYTSKESGTAIKIKENDSSAAQDDTSRPNQQTPELVNQSQNLIQVEKVNDASATKK